MLTTVEDDEPINVAFGIDIVVKRELSYTVIPPLMDWISAKLSVVSAVLLQAFIVELIVFRENLKLLEQKVTFKYNKQIVKVIRAKSDSDQSKKQ